jgi:hypothetical protein
MPEITTFEEFWPYYVKQHQKKATRIVHFLGTTAAGACVIGGLVTKRRWLLALAPVVGYGPLFMSHFFIEKNKPATFDYPVWSLRGDLKMWWLMARFRMGAEVERILAEERAQTVQHDAATDDTSAPATAHENAN